jgi:chromosome partitioning protein
MRKIAIINQKGGVGKTTTAVNLASGLSRNNKRVLLIDLDPQGNIATSIIENSDMGVYDFLFENAIFDQCIVHVGTNLDVMTSRENLTKAEFNMLQRKSPTTLLKEKFSKIKDYDYVIFDCAPSLGLLNQSALIYCEEAMIPVSSDPLGIDALGKMVVAIETINNSYMHDLQITKIIPTMYDQRNKICKEILGQMQNAFYTKITNPIRVCSKTKEAPQAKKSIFSYDKLSRGAADYKQLTSQVLQDEAFLNPQEELIAKQIIAE